MDDKRKKHYVKAELRQTRIELGVYGCYGGGETQQPNMPIDFGGTKPGIYLQS